MYGLVWAFLVVRFWRLGVILGAVLGVAWVLDTIGFLVGELLIVVIGWLAWRGRRRSTGGGPRRQWM
jgi:hypothetical protein